MYYNPNTTQFRPLIFDSSELKTLSAFTGLKDRNPDYESVPYVPKNWLDEKGQPIGISPTHPGYKTIKKFYLSLQLAEIKFLDKAVHLGMFKSSFEA